MGLQWIKLYKVWIQILLSYLLSKKSTSKVHFFSPKKSGKKMLIIQIPFFYYYNFCSLSSNFFLSWKEIAGMRGRSNEIERFWIPFRRIKKCYKIWICVLIPFLWSEKKKGGIQMFNIWINFGQKNKWDLHYNLFHCNSQSLIY